MKRHVSPTSGKIVQASSRYVKIGYDDCFAAFTISTFGTVATVFLTGILVSAISFWFFLVAVPWFLILILPWIVWGFASVSVGNDNSYVTDATKIYNELRDTFEETYAKPLANQIFQHAQEGHEGGRKNRDWYDDSCTICDDRVKTLKDLIPKKKLSTSTQELEEARRFITERDKIMGELT